MQVRHLEKKLNVSQGQMRFFIWPPPTLPPSSSQVPEGHPSHIKQAPRGRHLIAVMVFVRYENNFFYTFKGNSSRSSPVSIDTQTDTQGQTEPRSARDELPFPSLLAHHRHLLQPVSATFRGSRRQIIFNLPSSLYGFFFLNKCKVKTCQVVKP